MNKTISAHLYYISYVISLSNFKLILPFEECALSPNLKTFMEYRNWFQGWIPLAFRQIGMSYGPARLHRLAESIPCNRFPGSSNVYKFGLCFTIKRLKENNLGGSIHVYFQFSTKRILFNIVNNSVRTIVLLHESLVVLIFTNAIR